MTKEEFEDALRDLLKRTFGCVLDGELSKKDLKDALLDASDDINNGMYDAVSGDAVTRRLAALSDACRLFVEAVDQGLVTLVTTSGYAAYEAAREALRATCK